MDNLNLMKERLNYQGGVNQEDRMEKDKLRSLQKALLYSYQSETIHNENEETFKVLINSNKLNLSYDEKILSCEYDKNVQVGDVVYWEEAQSHWLVYMQEVTETAYFLGHMRRCSDFLIEKVENSSLSNLRVAVIGPKGSSIEDSEEGNFFIDFSNLTIEVWIANTEENQKAFQRYTKFKFKDATWEVQSVNNIDIPNILVISAKETYEIVEEPKEETPIQVTAIEGPEEIKPGQTHTYTIAEDIVGDWSWEGKSLEVLTKTDNSITIRWASSKSGSFTLSFGEETKNVKVASMF